MQTFTGHARNIFGSAISADGSTYYAGSYDGTVLAWDLTGRRGFGASFIGVDTENSWAMAWSPDSKVLATGDAFGTVNLWNVRTLDRTASFRAIPDAVNFLSFSPDGQSLLVQGFRLPPKHGGYLAIWSLHPARRLVREIPAFFKTLWASYSRDGKIIAASGSPKDAPGGFFDTKPPGDGQIAEWNAATGKLLARPLRIRGFGEAFSAGFAAHGTKLAVALIHDHMAIVDPAQHRVLLRWKASSAEQLIHAELSPDGMRVASADSDGYVSVWNAATGKRILPKIQANDGYAATWVNWSPDGSKLVTAGGDGTVRLYDAGSGQQIGPPLTSAASNFPGVMFSPDARSIAAADGTGRVWIYPVTVHAWAAYACQVANRNLTRAEWAKYVPGHHYQQICPVTH
ncbi:MAG TPA: WD40 repeat domain-containing protein [Mycobacterium sp.]|nr:WD40 repeat domain-containing protein [Mycobacterium sp.]